MAGRPPHLSADRLVPIILEALTAQLWVTDSDGVCVMTAGSPPDPLLGPGQGPSPQGDGDLVGQRLTDTLTDQPLRSDLAAALAGEVRDREHRAHGRVVETLLRPQRDNEGQVVAVAAVTHDVTPQHRAQRVASLFRALADNAGEFIGVASLDDAVQYLNPVARRMIGLPPDVDPTSLHISDLLPEENRSDYEEVERPALRRHGRWSGEGRLRNLATGIALDVEKDSFLIRDPASRQPLAVALIQRDITARKNAEAGVRRNLDQHRTFLLHLQEAQEAERRRIAADIHDDTIQVIGATTLRLETLARRVGAADPHAATELTGLARSVRDAAERLRGLLSGLGPPASTAGGLVEALRSHLATTFNDGSVTWTLHDDAPEPLSESLRHTVYRVAQEAITNVRKHADATAVDVAMVPQDGGLLLRVTDDGGGVRSFPEAAPAPGDREGYGVLGMRERVQSLGGWFQIAPRPDRGTVVEAWFPTHLDSRVIGKPPRALDARAALETALESITEGFAAFDDQWRFVYVNRRGGELLRRDPADLPGRVAWDELDWEPEVKEAWRRAYADQAPVEVETFYPRWDRWYQHRIFPSPHGVSVFFDDITESKEAHLALEERTKSARVLENVALALGADDLTTALHSVCTVLVDELGLRMAEVRTEDPAVPRIQIETRRSPRHAAVDDTVAELPLFARGATRGTLVVSRTEPLPEALQATLRAVAVQLGVVLTTTWDSGETVDHAGPAVRP